jgi:hypothetical protein
MVRAGIKNLSVFESCFSAFYDVLKYLVTVFW